MNLIMAKKRSRITAPDKDHWSMNGVSPQEAIDLHISEKIKDVLSTLRNIDNITLDFTITINKH